MKIPLIYDKIYRNKNENKHMKTEHNYFELENSLTHERCLVYRGGPRTAPGAGESAEKAKQKPEQKETPEQVAKRALDTIDWIDGMRDFLKNPKYKKMKKFSRFDKKLAVIQKKLVTILENNSDRKANMKKRVLSMLEETASISNQVIKAYRKKFNLPEPKSTPKLKQKAPTVKKSSEKSKERVPNSPKEKLSYLLGKVLEDGAQSFAQNKNEIAKLLKSMNIKPGEQNQAAGFNLPGGFTVGHVNWPKKAGSMPNFAIFKDGQTLCYMQDTGGGKMELSFARQLSPNERPGYNRRMVELIKANVLLPRALSQVKTHPKTKNLIFANPSALNDFKLALLTMAKMSKLSKKAGPDWEAVYGGKNIQFERSGQSLNGVFKIQVGNNIMYFDTANPSHIGLEQPGKNGKKEISYWNDRNFLLSPKEQKQQDRRQSILKKRSISKAKYEKQERMTRAEKQKRVDEQKRLQKQREQEKRQKEQAYRGKVSKLLNPKFKKLISESKTDPKSFTVKADKNNKKGLRLIKNTPIHKLLNLKQSKTEVVLITIKGAPGKPERKAMYYPGQKTAYRVDAKGKQTKSRVKFHNGDTISLDFKKPEKADYANLNRDKSKLVSQKTNRRKTVVRKKPSSPFNKNIDEA